MKGGGKLLVSRTLEDATLTVQKLFALLLQPYRSPDTQTDLHFFLKDLDDGICVEL